MYRLKEAIIIFWAVLTHKYYIFISAHKIATGGAGCCYISSPAEKSKKFYELVSHFTDQKSQQIKNYNE